MSKEGSGEDNDSGMVCAGKDLMGEVCCLIVTGYVLLKAFLVYYSKTPLLQHM